MLQKLFLKPTKAVVVRAEPRGTLYFAPGFDTGDSGFGAAGDTLLLPQQQRVPSHLQGADISFTSCLLPELFHKSSVSTNCSTRREEGYRMWACKAADPHNICILPNDNNNGGVKTHSS